MAGEEPPDDSLRTSHPDAAEDGSKSLEGGPGLFVWLLTAAAGISGLLFGCG